MISQAYRTSRMVRKMKDEGKKSRGWKEEYSNESAQRLGSPWRLPVRYRFAQKVGTEVQDMTEAQCPDYLLQI